RNSCSVTMRCGPQAGPQTRPQSGGSGTDAPVPTGPTRLSPTSNHPAAPGQRVYRQREIECCGEMAKMWRRPCISVTGWPPPRAPGMLGGMRIALVLALSVAPTVASAAQPKLAVLPLTARRVPEATVQVLDELVVSELDRRGTYQIIGTND